MARARSSTSAVKCARPERLNSPLPALVATAHKIARTVYHMLKHHVAYYDIGATQYDRTQQERELIYLKKKAAKLGFTLTPHEPVPIAGHV